MEDKPTERTNRFESFAEQHKKMTALIKKVVMLIGIIVLIFLMVELSSYLFLKVYLSLNSGANDSLAELEVYKDKNWAKEYFQEFEESSVMEYVPYTEFKRKPNYFGKYINLDLHSLRKTYYPCVDKNNQSLTIFIFGGSTMWGSGARDHATIASQLSKKMCEKGIPVTITNYGESGYVNTQELLRLELELRAGKIPNIIIFYDGFNDVFSAYQNRISGYPQNVGNRIKEFNLRKRFNPYGLMPNFNEIIERVLRAIMKKGSVPAIGSDLARGISETYLGNIKIVKGLEKEFKFKALYYWQPTVFTKENRSKNEKELLNNPEMQESFLITTKKVKELIPEMTDLTNIFDQQPSTIYIDWSHITEEGNELVAEAIADNIFKEILKNNYLQPEIIK